MDDRRDLENLYKLKKQREVQKAEQYKQSSKERLKKIAAKKVNTTMIGALDAIEKNFGFLWEPDENGNISEVGVEMRGIYDKVRETILDNGNNQIRNLMTELEQYEITWKRFQVTLPVKKIGD